MLKYFYLFIAFLIGFSLSAQESFDSKQTTSSNVRLTITNIGTFGNSLDGYRDGTGNPSCEYPAGSGIEHLFESGIWLGGLENGGNAVVSTSAYDNTTGYSPGSPGFEMTAELGASLIERSSLFDSKFFDPRAVSHQDFIAYFTDKNTRVPNANGDGPFIQDHTTPMWM